MDISNKMVEILDKYIKKIDYKTKELYSLEIKRDLFENVLFEISNNDILSLKERSIYISILLNTIYDNNIMYTEFYSSLLEYINNNNKKDFEKFYYKIEYKLNKLNRRIQILRDIISNSSSLYQTAKSVKRSYENGIILCNNDYIRNMIKDIIKDAEDNNIITNTYGILLANEINSLKVLGINKTIKEKNLVEYQDTINTAKLGGWTHDEYDMDKHVYANVKSYTNVGRNTITEFINKEIKEDYSGYSLDKIKAYVKSTLNTIKNELDDKEYIYLLNELLKEIFEEIQVYKELMLDKNLHFDRFNVRSIINSVNKYIEVYLTIKEEYDLLIESFDEIIFEEYEEPSGVNKLIYSLNSSLKPKILSDMKSISPEYYKQIESLLLDFKKGELTNTDVKKLANNKKYNKNFELRGDQVRIVLKKINGNIYAVQGVFIKKQDNDVTSYANLALRDTPVINNEQDINNNLELAQLFETDIHNFVEKNYRKSNRF